MSIVCIVLSKHCNSVEESFVSCADSDSATRRWEEVAVCVLMCFTLGIDSLCRCKILLVYPFAHCLPKLCTAFFTSHWYTVVVWNVLFSLDDRSNVLFDVANAIYSSLWRSEWSDSISIEDLASGCHLILELSLWICQI